MLRKKNIHAYLPTNIEFRKWSDRIKKLNVPLFPNYLFVNIVESHAATVLQTQGIMHFVSFAGKRSIIPFSEMELIEKLCSGGVDMEVGDFLENGDFVEIQRGPFSGLQGILFEKRGTNRFGVNITSLGKNISIDISASHVRKQQVLTSF